MIMMRSPSLPLRPRQGRRRRTVRRRRSRRWRGSPAGSRNRSGGSPPTCYRPARHSSRPPTGEFKFGLLALDLWQHLCRLAPWSGFWR